MFAAKALIILVGFIDTLHGPIATIQRLASRVPDCHQSKNQRRNYCIRVRHLIPYHRSLTLGPRFTWFFSSRRV